MTGPQGGFEPRGPGRTSTDEARATASALLDWLGTRVDGLDAGTPDPGAGSARPSQSPGPCTWCPICALVAAFRGEQPELTARLTEHATALMGLLRLMVQAHQDPSHGHHHGHHAAAGPAASTTPPPPPGWPAEWGAWDGWGMGAADPAPEDAARADEPGPAPEPHTPEPHTRGPPAPEPESPRPAPTPAGSARPRPAGADPPVLAALGRVPGALDHRHARHRADRCRPDHSGRIPGRRTPARSASPRRRTPPRAPAPGCRLRLTGRRRGTRAGHPRGTGTAAPRAARPPDRSAHRRPARCQPVHRRPPAATPRPSVQRIAIRRPARPGRTDRTDADRGERGVRRRHPVLTVGVDIGGTSVRAGVVDADGTVVATAATPTARDAAGLDDAIVDLVRGLAEQHRIGAVGLAIAGFVDPDRRTVAFGAHLPWRDDPVAERLAARLDLPVVIEHDANAAGLAEHRVGAAAGACGGRPRRPGHRDRRGAAGRRGRCSAGPTGSPPSSGTSRSSGAAGPARAASAAASSATAAGPRWGARRRSWSPTPRSSRCCGRRGSARSRSPAGTWPGPPRRGDVLAARVVDEFADWLGQALSLVADVFDPDVVVVGGEVSASSRPVPATGRAAATPRRSPGERTAGWPRSVPRRWAVAPGWWAPPSTRRERAGV